MIAFSTSWSGPGDLLSRHDCLYVLMLCAIELGCWHLSLSLIRVLLDLAAVLAAALVERVGNFPLVHAC